MDMMFYLMFALFFIPGIIVLFDFLFFVVTGRRKVHSMIMGAIEFICFLIYPAMYANFGYINNCCADSLNTAVFAPDHQLTMLVLISLCLLAYFYSSYRSSIAPPVLELMVNSLLFICIILNIFIAFHTEFWLFALIGNVPIILLTILNLVRNHKLFLEHWKKEEIISRNKLESYAWKILSAKPFVKFPILLILCLPLLTTIIGILMLFGQKSDSVIRAFTDTYQHGFSQLDHECDNVNCGGHYLCSVAALGHKRIVRPQRLGYRHDQLIICNRQLLVSNAFEDLIREKMPGVHRLIRHQYDKVGTLVHRYYSLFNIKIISDIIYILMKPAEWVFLLILYTCDVHPENRISKQYLETCHRYEIDLYYSQVKVN